MARGFHEDSRFFKNDFERDSTDLTCRQESLDFSWISLLLWILESPYEERPLLRPR